MKNLTADAIKGLFATASTIYVLVEILFSELLFPILRELITAGWLASVIMGAISAGLYATILAIVMFFYEQFIFKVKYKKLILEGKWFYVHLPYNIDGEIDKTRKVLRVGEAKVKRNFFDFFFRGENEDASLNENNEVVYKSKTSKAKKIGGKKTGWSTKVSFYDPDVDTHDILSIYYSRTTGDQTITVETCPICKTHHDSPVKIKEAGIARYGVHQLELVEDEETGKTIRIDGKYNDTFPSMKRGEIIFFRSREERDQFTKEQLED